MAPEAQCIQDLTDVIFPYIVADSDIIETETSINQIKNNYKVELSLQELLNEFREDSILFETILQDNPNSRRQRLKQLKEDIEPNDNKLSLEDALKYNPQKFVKYMYYSQKQVQTKRISGEFDRLKCILSYLPSSTDEEKDVKKSTWKMLWKWIRIGKPGFKLMPLNEIKKHFIRLDKKAFVELGTLRAQMYSISPGMMKY